MKSMSEIQAMLTPVVSSLGYELVGCQFANENGKSILRVYIDGPVGVNIDDCAKVSRQVGAVFNVEDPIQGRYTLEVTSPGLDRPLFNLAQYERFVGRKIKVRLRVPQNDRRNFTGVLLAVADNSILLNIDEAVPLKLLFNQIEKANLVPEF